MLGFIGCGNMAQAMIKGILEKKLYAAEEIIVSRRNQEALSKLKDQFALQVTADNKKDALVISIAAGQTMGNIERLFGKNIKLVRSMPNTPALVLEGAAGVCFNENITEEDKKKTMEIFSSFGIAHEVSENMIDTVIGVSGSSPAYVFMFIEAMADAAVADGMPRAQAYELAAQSVLGSARMVLETGRHPGELKDMVCSPGGTTIEAVRVLEKEGFRSAVIEAMKACVKKAREM